MNHAQLLAFKASIQGNGAIAAALASGDQGAIAAAYNALGTGSIWLPAIPTSQLLGAIVWSEFVALTVQQQNAYLALAQGGTVDATNANIRSGFSTIFAGKVTLTNLSALAQRVPTVFEALFTTANVCALFGYIVQPSDVAAALASS